MATPVDRKPERQSERPRAIPEVLAVHFEEFAGLLAIRSEHVRGPDWTLGDLAEWDARLTAHMDALVIAGDEAIPLLEEQLAGDDPAAVFAAAVVLLRIKTQIAAERLLSALAGAKGPQLIALADALAAGPIDGIDPRLRELASKGSPPQSLIAFLGLAAHGRVDSRHVPGDEALASEDPHVRQLAWRCIAQLPSRT
jgi:HEAT repeat protein